MPFARNGAEGEPGCRRFYGVGGVFLMFHVKHFWDDWGVFFCVFDVSRETLLFCFLGGRWYYFVSYVS